MMSSVDHVKARNLFRGKSRVLFACMIAVALCAAQDAVAQSTTTGVPNAMQGFSQNRDKPIQIDAATLEMRDKDKAATFSGDVKVVQGDTTMRCKTLVVFYDNNDQSASGAKACHEVGDTWPEWEFLHPQT